MNFDVFPYMITEHVFARLLSLENGIVPEASIGS